MASDRAARVAGRRGGRSMEARVRGTLVSKGIHTDAGGYDTICQIVRREVKRAVEECAQIASTTPYPYPDASPLLDSSDHVACLQRHNTRKQAHSLACAQIAAAIRARK